MSREVYRLELRELFRLAVPLAAAQAGNQLMGITDIAVLGRYGATELAACGLGNALFFAISVVGMGIVLGVDPLVSQALGAGDRAGARRALWQGCWLALITAAALTFPLVLSPLVLGPFGVQEDLIRPASVYLLIRTISFAPMLLFLVGRAYLQAFSITRPMIVATILCNVFNLVADILLVFGGGVLPEWTGPLRMIPSMGVAGAAIVTVVAQLIQLAIVGYAALQTGHTHDDRALRRWDGAEVRRAFSVGWPVALHMGAEVGIFALVGLLAARLGTAALAAHQVVLSIASLTFTMAVGVAAAGSVRVGLAVGASDEVATRAAGRASFVGGVLVMGAGAAAFALFPGAIARLMTDEPAVIAVAIPLFVVAAVFQLSDGVQAVGAGVLRGAADTRFTLVANLIGHWVVGFPLAIYLGFVRDMGIVGLWWGLCAGLTAVAIQLYARFEILASKPIRTVEEHPA